MTTESYEAPNFQISNDGSASQPPAQNLKFERTDWTSFRTVEGLQQKAGVAANKLRRLVLKELTDNALDTGASVKVGETPEGVYFIEDDGPGIGGTPEEIARLFSISRPMISTKLLRLPTCGALGNGLRVVAGAVLSSEGSLVVTTGNRRIELKPQHDGSTKIVGRVTKAQSKGTRIEIALGDAIPSDSNALKDARAAILMAGGASYTGRSSPHWYDGPSFHELLLASSDVLVRDLVASLDGCTGARAGEIVNDAGLSRRKCNKVTREQAIRLLEVARQATKPVNPQWLGAVGAEMLPHHQYATSSGLVSLGTGEVKAELPFVVEAWAKASGDTSVHVSVNRTPVSGNIRAYRKDREVNVFGCGLSHTVAEAPKGTDFDIWLNVITPFMPITSDGKEPNLRPFIGTIGEAVAKAVRKARNPSSTSGVSQKDVVLDNLDDVIALVSGDEGYRFNARQLFYALRPIVMGATGKELKIANFTGIIDDFEKDNGEIELMYREPRGSITHPHRNETITLGTLMVEQYERPVWNFNKLLYIEKEGAMEALKQDRWCERHDCAVMSSKGFSTRAARDLIDKLAEHDEPCEVFCGHDADAYGTMIYQTLQEETTARGARKIKIVNLGLDPWEAVAMGLEVETLEKPKQRKAVAAYVLERDEEQDEDWADWLQTNRVELNAMTTPQLIAWLDRKMDENGDGKLIPPVDVLEAELTERIESKVRAAITERILREAKLDDQVAAAIARITTPDGDTLAQEIERLFEEEPDREWRDAIEAVAAKSTC